MGIFDLLLKNKGLLQNPPSRGGSPDLLGALGPLAQNPAVLGALASLAKNRNLAGSLSAAKDENQLRSLLSAALDDVKDLSLSDDEKRDLLSKAKALLPLLTQKR